MNNKIPDNGIYFNHKRSKLYFSQFKTKLSK